MDEGSAIDILRRETQRSVDVLIGADMGVQEEDEPIQEELDEMDEDGLFAYERLGETFERELFDIGELYIRY